MTEKDDRISKEDKAMRYKFTSKQDKDAIKKKVKEIKRQREQEKQTQQKEQDKAYFKHRNVMKNLHHKLLREKGGAPNDGPTHGYPHAPNSNIYDVSHSQPAIKTQQQNNAYSQKQGITLNGKLTLESLGQLKYEDISRGGPDDFNPADVLDEDDSDSEDEVLKRYRDYDRVQNNEGMHVNESINSIPISNQDNPYKPPKASRKTNSIERIHDQPLKSQPRGHRKGGLNNSIAEVPSQLKKNLSKKMMAENSRSKKNLLLKPHDPQPTNRKRGGITDDERTHKGKLRTERSKKAQLPKDVHNSISKPHNPYEEDNKPKGSKYGGNVTRSVKKSSTKAPLSQKSIDKSKS